MDPTLKNKILTNLNKMIPELPKGLRTIAKYIIDHPSDFGLDPIRETAQKAGVSTYTLIRLAERVGVASYDELREPFRLSLVSAAASVDQPLWIEGLRERGELGKIQADATVNSMAIVQRSLEHLDLDRMQRVIDLLLGAKGVYLTAVRASYAMAFYLHYVGRMVLPSLQLIPRHMGSAIDDLHMAGKGDVMIAITLTPCSRETIEACQFAQSKGIKLILISDTEIVSPEFRADETLIASILSTHHFGCYTGMMAVIETLLAMLMAQGGDDAQERIDSYEKLRNETNAYWVAPKKH
ncbi:MurR/RpiR family transcriptional regulator [Marinomonas colpomeniae]|uniref:MurR/RpiR family transcriptional regulator n=1 Tax=Marinomonas colpomeniae TaxID=2774408 RepID=A0ABR8NTU7_9GAMM|nr:MurR/RpiR family transcriptional regulator [Marinomonas colpomeniae]MBD5769476.1 MurR/RpiR family transcriptional regulator [Marinomonas colpomeniae]